MAVDWTREQRQVIESRSRNLLVSAAAGSGKTAVLVERIVRMVTEGEHPLEIDRLLVMTFTRAAAAEMRERIQEAIEKKLEEQPDNGHLQRQAVMAQYARITTIDSFCLYILKEHFDRLHLDPAFRVGDEGEMLLLRADVMRTAGSAMRRLWTPMRWERRTPGSMRPFFGSTHFHRAIRGQRNGWRAAGGSLRTLRPRGLTRRSGCVSF